MFIHLYIPKSDPELYKETLGNPNMHVQFSRLDIQYFRLFDKKLNRIQNGPDRIRTGDLLRVRETSYRQTTSPFDCRENNAALFNDDAQNVSGLIFVLKISPVSFPHAKIPTPLLQNAAIPLKNVSAISSLSQHLLFMLNFVQQIVTSVEDQ